jgi:hypothetical protein
VQPPKNNEKDPTLQVRYSYVFRGQTYESSQFRISSQAFEDSSAYVEAERFTVGASVPCWVNPASPAQAVLHKASAASALIVLFPLIFVAAGAGGIWAMWRKGKASSSANAPLTQRTQNAPKTRLIMVLFCSVFLLAGLGFTYGFLILPITRILAARSWEQAPCEIVSSRVQRHSDSDGDTYSIDIVYRYPWRGRTYTSNRYHFVTGSSSGYEGKAEVVRQFPQGARALCYVNPKNPSEAVIDRDFSSSIWVGLFPLLFVLFGAGGLYFTLKQQPASSANWGPKASTFRGASTAFSADSEAGTLSPSVSGKMKLLGLLFAAVFWNGIVSVFVVNLFTERWSGTNWFLVLFLTPFVLVGLGLIGGAFYQAMALFNPKPVLNVSRRSAAPSDTVEVRWTFSGQTHRLNHLKLTFEGREEATYRRGTDTKTDKETFKVITLAETADPMAISSGSVKLLLPADVMHSFQSPNNKIVWVFKLKGAIPRWPNVNEEYIFTVNPHLLPS